MNLQKWFRGNQGTLKAIILSTPILLSTLVEAKPIEEVRPPTTEENKAAEPFAFADFSWLNGNSRQKTFPLATKYFTGQFYFDGNIISSDNNPTDHSLVGSTNSGRVDELQIQQLGIGGDFLYENVRGRLMTQFGLYSTMTPRNDASPGRGQWKLEDAYRYLSEAYAGYHWDVWNGINLDAGLFMSYIGLCSYYNYENWVYQMSYVSANTPWFFNGLRLQIYPSDKLKTEFWLINGWQSYGMFNNAPGVGIQVLWRPTGDWSLVTNNYYGKDTLGKPDRTRFHTDNSIQLKYLDRPNNFLTKIAASLTADYGCESGNGVTCSTQKFAGFMFYNRFWFNKDLYAATLGFGRINNPGRYLVLVPSINGATAFSGTPYFSANPGDPFKAWDTSFTWDFMPKEMVTFRLEFIHREANVPYFAGHGGITPPGGNQGAAGSAVADWTPDLVKSENRINLGIMVRL